MLDRTESGTPRVATGMIWIPGGTLRVGSDKHYAEAAPVRSTKPMCRRPAASRKIRAAAGTA
jgi:formylglycine-generating enzyme required for sulfatase activity